MKISKPTAAISPALSALRKLTDSRGNRAMIQVNSSQEMSTDIASDDHPQRDADTRNIFQPKPFQHLLHQRPNCPAR